MPHQTDDAQLPAELPPNPFASSPPASPKQRSTPPIDLNPSPKPPLEARDRQYQPDNKRPGLASKRRVSDDERRLTGDYDVPADRVIAPDPGSYFRPSRHPAMGKPGSGSAFQPGLNTLDGPRRAPSGLNNITYGKKSRGYAPGSGTVSNGQAAFEEFHISGPATPASKAPARRGHAIQSVRVSPTKRRKTETSTAPQIIDLVDDDEVQEVERPDQPATPALRDSHRPPPSISAQSRHSTESRPTLKAPPAGSTSANEFLGTEAFLKTARRPEKKGFQQDLTHISSRRSASGSITPQTHTTPILSQEDKEDMAAARASRLSNSRRIILKECKQGIQAPHSDLGKPKVVTSRHFENARINESTIDRQRPTVTQRNGASESLRSFKRATNTNSHDAYSDDELGQDTPKTAMTAPLRSGSPSKSARTANSGARRKTKAQEAAQGWPLIRARTHGFDSKTTLMSTAHEHPLVLRHGKDLNTFEIAYWSDKKPDCIVPGIITSKNVVKGYADSVRRTRLEGSRPTEGDVPIFDLEFMYTEHFDDFRDNHLPNYCAGGKVFTKKVEHMDILFDKSLLKIDKVKKPLLVQDTPPAEASPRSTRAQASGTAIWNQMKTGTHPTRRVTSNGGLPESSDSVAQARASTRPTRSTRANAPTHDTYESDHDDQLQRFSVVHGLGTPWVRELTFGEGRQRAQVIFDDLVRLDEGEFLNDNLIDFYMIYLFKESNVSPSKVHFFNTFFYKRLKQNTGREYINYEAVRRWTRDDIFTHDYIVVPINEDIHWYLAIICNVGNIARKAIEEDFDDPNPTKKTDASEALTKDGNAPTTKPQSFHEPGEASNAPAEGLDLTTVGAADDANLFDEESNLNLIDPDATHTTVGQLETININSPKVSSPTQGATRATPSIFDPPPTSKTVLSNLHASPEKRKTKKRRSTAPRRDPTQPVIIILDSLSQTRTPAVRALKEWIAAEGKAKRGMEATIKEKGLYPKGDQIPTQSNFSDCGVYLLGYAEKFFQDPDTFTQKLLTGEMTPDEDWPQLKPKEMRINLRDIIFTLADEQQLTVSTKKKSRKSAAAEKSSPAKVDTKTPEPGLPPPPVKHPVSNVEKSCAVPPQTATTVTDPEPSKVQGNSTAARPRLGSPFTFKETEKSASPAKAPPRAIRSASPSKTGSTTPHQDRLHGRHTHPEVRVPKRASPVEKRQAKVHVAMAQAQTQAIGEDPQSKGAIAQSASPLKRTRDGTGMDEHGSFRAKSTPAVSSTEPKRNTGTHAPKTLDGGVGHPIEFPDSQEQSHTTHSPPPRTKAASPKARKQESRSPRLTHVLTQEPSLEEIPRFPSQIEESQSQQTEDEFVGSQLVAQLDAHNAQIEASRHNSATLSLQRKQSDPDPDVMEIDSQGNDPMDIAEDSITDDVIRETPEAARRSPSVLPL